MATLLVRGATALATMDPARTEIADAGLYAVDGIIHQVGPTDALPASADEVLDLSGHAVLPGLINTHHHFSQTLTRAVPGAQNAGLFTWLSTLYPIWARMTPEHLSVATQVALAELALSGCTTAFDHTYIFPNGASVDDQVDAALQMGLRFVASRGSMSLGESAGGLPPDSLVETDDAILSDSQRVIELFHDPTPGAMTQIVVAPCSPFSVTTDLMRTSAELARAQGVRLHTHLAETADENDFCRETYGMRPVELAEDLSWIGPDVWFAHGVFIDDDESDRLGAAGTGVAHCPTSNMRLASGIAPVRTWLGRGVPVGLGVDGSASNDGSHLLGEVRQAMLLARLDASPTHAGGPLLTAREALEMATVGGAAVLGRTDIGSLEPGKAADFTAVDLSRLEFAGAHHDPIAALVFAAPVSVDYTYVHGRAVVSEGELVTADLGPLIERHNRLAAQLVDT